MMYKNILAIIGFAFLLVSCSSDKNEAEAEVGASSILGTWDATELRIDNATASDDSKFLKGALDLLTEKDCYIVTLQFNEDLSATATNSASYVVLDVTGSNFNIPCPTEADEQSSTYTFDGKTVTTIDSDGNELVIDVTINGDIMTVDAADLDIPNFSDDGQLVFVKR
ncbi:lipocalin family protein [Maribacter hydrothermalis]|nr:lipocalin family protein [Maribacter hydrothermalis]